MNNSSKQKFDSISFVIAHAIDSRQEIATEFESSVYVISTRITPNIVGGIRSRICLSLWLKPGELGDSTWGRLQPGLS